MDKQHGICTEPSRNAWSIVDAIYEKMQAIRTEHAAQPSTRSNQEQSSRQESRRTQLNESIQNQAFDETRLQVVKLDKNDNSSNNDNNGAIRYTKDHTTTYKSV
eukprot:scaffold5955_cov89-Skeletonema_dohrnii-CCMP3373.AAC.4